MKENDIQYIVWQNHAFEFYVAARTLYMHGNYGPAAFCACQSIETLLKATLIYWDKSFKPEGAGHKVKRMLNSLKNKVPNSKDFFCPHYFYSDSNYQSVSRYPDKKKNIGIPATFLGDLDKVIFSVVVLVPFQHNSLLTRALKGKSKMHLLALRRGNSFMRKYRNHFGIRLKA